MLATKANSLKWAIDELSKQREELDAKLKVARKRDETHCLIEEVFAQKKALEQRINALEDGLKESSSQVSTPSVDLESEMSQIDEKLDIAKERLQAIEQEEYLEELGKKLNRNHEDSGVNDMGKTWDGLQPSQSEDTLSISSQPGSIPNEIHSSDKSAETDSNLSASTLTTSISKMKPTTNRIENQEAESQEAPGKVTSTKPIEEKDKTFLSLEETAQKLGIEPDFLMRQSSEAILRMIARNGGKLTFPLEVEQTD